MELKEEENTLLNKVGIVYFYIPHRIYHLGKVFNAESKAFDINFINLVSYFIQGKLALLDNEGEGNYFGVLPSLSVIGPTYENGLKLSEHLKISPYYSINNNMPVVLHNPPMEKVSEVLKGFCGVNLLDKNKVSHIIDNEIEKYINEDASTIVSYLLTLNGFSSLLKEHHKIKLTVDMDTLVEENENLLKLNVEIPMKLIIEDSVAEKYFDFKDELITNMSKFKGDEDLTFNDVKDFVEFASKNLKNIDNVIKEKFKRSMGIEVDDDLSIKKRLGLFEELFGSDNEVQKQIVLDIIDNFENREEKDLLFLEHLMHELEKLISSKIKDKLDNLKGDD